MINLTGSWKQDMIIRQVEDMTLWFPINVTLLILFSLVALILTVLLALPGIGGVLRHVLIEQNLMWTLTGMIGITYILNKAKIDGKTPLHFIGTICTYSFQVVWFVFQTVWTHIRFIQSLENTILFEKRKKGGQ